MHGHDRDGRLAARRMQPPSDTATAIMNNHGYEPGVLAVAALPATDTAVAATPTAEPATTRTL